MEMQLGVHTCTGNEFSWLLGQKTIMGEGGMVLGLWSWVHEDLTKGLETLPLLSLAYSRLSNRLYDLLKNHLLASPYCNLIGV